MVELVNASRVKEWLQDRLHLSSEICDKMRIYVQGNVIKGILDVEVTHYWTEKSRRAYAEAFPGSLQYEEAQYLTQLEHIANRRKEISELRNSVFAPFKRKQIAELERDLEYSMNIMAYTENQLNEAKTRMVEEEHTRSEEKHYMIPFIEWNTDYDSPSTLQLLTGVTKDDDFWYRINYVGLRRMEGVMKLEELGFDIYELEDDLLNSYQTTVNDNAIVALMYEKVKDFEYIIEQAGKNRSDAKFKIFLATDKNFKLKYLQGTLEQLIS